MAASGTGTAADPYVVDNWTDFLTVCNVSATTYVKWADTENKVVDFNEINNEGLDDTIAMKGHIDFNSWELRNLWSKAQRALSITGTSSNIADISNVKITNARHTSDSTSNNAFIYVQYGNILNSSMSYEFDYRTASYAIQTSNRGGYFDRVGIYAYGMVTNGGWCFVRTSLDEPERQARNCRFHCDVQGTDVISSNSGDLAHIALQNSVISGTIIVDNDTVTSIPIGHTTSALNVIRIQSNKEIVYGGTGISLKVDKDYTGDIVRPDISSWTEHVLTVNTSQARTQQEAILAAGFPLHRAVD